MKAVLEALLDQRPDGVMANFALKTGGPLFSGAIRRCKLAGLTGYYEALCKTANAKGGPTEDCMVYFEGENLGFVMIPLEPPTIVAPGGGGGLIRGMRGEGN